MDILQRKHRQHHVPLRVYHLARRNVASIPHISANGQKAMSAVNIVIALAAAMTLIAFSRSQKLVRTHADVSARDQAALQVDVAKTRRDVAALQAELPAQVDKIISKFSNR